MAMKKALSILVCFVITFNLFSVSALADTTETRAAAVQSEKNYESYDAVQTLEDIVDIDEFEEIPDIDGEEDLSSLPKELADLMRENNVSRLEIQLAVSDKGYYPIDTPIENYDPAFVRGVLVGAWQQVFLLICENRKDPFQE